MNLKVILSLQIVLLASQGVLGGPRQKRPLDLEKAEQNQDHVNLVADTLLLDKELAARGLIAPTRRGLDSEAKAQTDDAPGGVDVADQDVVAVVADDEPVVADGELAEFREADGDGFFCMDKVMTVTEIVYDEEVRCNHVNYKNCYQAYKTVYKPQETEHCVDNFKKECFIEYEDVAKTEVIRICTEKADRDCTAEGEQICKTVFVTICETKFRKYNLNDQSANCTATSENVCFTETVNGQETKVCRDVPKTECEVIDQDLSKSFPETECRKEPCEVCGPERCPIVTSQTCEDKEKTFVTPVPKERCEIKPYKVCNTEVINLPSLEQETQCVLVPKEVCSVEQVNPRQVARPIIKKWCSREPFPSATSSPPPSGSSTTPPTF